MITHAPDMPRLLHAWLTQQVEGKHELHMHSQRPGRAGRTRCARSQRRTVAAILGTGLLIVAAVLYALEAGGPRMLGVPAAAWIAGLGGLWALLAAWPRRRELPRSWERLQPRASPMDRPRRSSRPIRSYEVPIARAHRSSVLYRDDHLAVVDKPAGLMVHDSALARGETDFAADRLREQFGKPIFLVHRLDRATSGCLLLAFDRDTASALGKMLMSRASVEKDYLAICRGWPEAALHRRPSARRRPGQAGEETGDHPLRAPRHHRTGSAVAAASTTSRYALLRAQPQTGRFRQIRRHLKHLSHHLIGDTSHGDGRHNRTFRMLGIHRMLLHARRLAFVHPHGGERIEAIAPPDAEFARALALFDAA